MDRSSQLAIDFYDLWFLGCTGGTISVGGRSGPFSFVELKGKLKGADISKAVNGRPDIYYRLCPMAKAPAQGRGDASSTIMLPGLWLDIDVGDKKNGKIYFATKGEALDWLRTAFWHLGPCAVVDSGNGLHGYFKADEVQSNFDELDYDVNLVSKRFQYWVASRCPYDMDMTFDLARVLRAPGSFNGGKLVKVIDFNPEKAFAMSDLLDMLPDDLPVEPARYEQCESHPKNSIDVHLLNKLEVAQENDQPFRRMWKGNYSSLKDESPSGYCMAIANRLVYLHFEPEDIRAALYVWREKMGAGQKPPGWYDRTVSKAMSRGPLKRSTSSVQDEEEPEVEDEIRMIEEANKGDDRMRSLDMLSVLLGTPVSDFVERRSPVTAGKRGDSTYTIKFKEHDGEIDLGIEQLLNTNAVITKAFQETKVVPPIKTDYSTKKKRDDRWLAAVSLAVKNATIQEGYCSDSLTGLIEEMIEGFVSGQLTVKPPAENPHAMKDSLLCWVDGRIAFKRRGLTTYMNDEDVKIGRKELSSALMSLGIENRRFTKVYLWVLPDAWSTQLANSA